MLWRQTHLPGPFDHNFLAGFFGDNIANFFGNLIANLLGQMNANLPWDRGAFPGRNWDAFFNLIQAANLLGIIFADLLVLAVFLRHFLALFFRNLLAFLPRNGHAMITRFLATNLFRNSTANLLGNILAFGHEFWSRNVLVALVELGLQLFQLSSLLGHQTIDLGLQRFSLGELVILESVNFGMDLVLDAPFGQMMSLGHDGDGKRSRNAVANLSVDQLALLDVVSLANLFRNLKDGLKIGPLQNIRSYK